MILVATIIVLLISTILGYYFAAKQGAIGSFLTVLFLFALPALIYVIQSS